MIIPEAIKILKQGTRKSNPAYLDSGNHCDAYLMIHQDQSLVIKYYHHLHNIIDSINDAEIHLDLYNKAKGIDFVPKIVGSCLKNRFIICEYIDGRLLKEIDVCSFDSTELSTAIYYLIETYGKLYDAGLKVDSIKANFKYHNQRFYIIDFALKTDDDTIEKEIIKLPILLSSSDSCLIILIELILNQLINFEELSQKVKDYVDSNYTRVHNYELNYRKIDTINLNDKSLEKVGVYVQYLSQSERRMNRFKD